MAVASEAKRSRSGSEKRRRSAQVSVRMFDEHRDVFQRLAEERGMRSAAELIFKQCEPLLVAAGVSINP